MREAAGAKDGGRGVRSAVVAWQGPSHSWAPLAAAGVVGAVAWMLGRGVGEVVAAVGVTGAAVGAAWLVFREPPPRKMRPMAVVALVAGLVATVATVAAVAGWPAPGTPGAPGRAAVVALGALALAVGSAHPVIVRRTRGGQASMVLSWAGPVLALGAMGVLVGAERAVVGWLAVGGVVVALGVAWMALLVRARREERDPARGVRLACPRCGVVQSRAPGKEPCSACGLFLLVLGAQEAAAQGLLSETERAAREASAGRSAAARAAWSAKVAQGAGGARKGASSVGGGAETEPMREPAQADGSGAARRGPSLAKVLPHESLWLVCPCCRLRLWVPRGSSACPQCRYELLAEWNVHATGAWI